MVYIDVPSLSEESPTDEAVALVKTFQWEDWRDLRFEDRTSSAYRRGVARLAQRLVDASRSVIAEDLRAPEVTSSADVSTDNASEEELGTLDLLALAEEAIPQLAAAISDISPEMETIGNLAQKAAEDVQRSDQEGKGFAARLTISRKLAQDMSAPADRILSLANTYTASLYDADRGITALIQNAPDEIKNDPSTKSAWSEFAQNITQLAAATNEGMAGIKGLAEGLETTE